MKDKILEAVQISKTYGEGESAVQALKASDLTIWKGEFASIIGSSGSGKSTLLKILGGLLPPTTGNVLLDGQDIYAMNAEQLAQVRRLYFSGLPAVPGVYGAGQHSDSILSRPSDTGRADAP